MALATVKLDVVASEWERLTFSCRRRARTVFLLTYFMLWSTQLNHDRFDRTALHDLLKDFLPIPLVFC